jgi:lipopolysaccharide/colanic/teichoic acid biosynthesis glycosyltransferase
MKYFFSVSQTLVKEIIDRLTAAILLVIFSPIIILVAIAVAIRMGYPVVFTQPRPGKNGRVFTFYKFRSMTNECDADGDLLPETERLTAFGKFLRQTSLDELPQLWNVLKGDMSFVGPRPLLVEHLDYYTPEQARRHDVKPGITGWAQVNGRHNLSWLEKCDLDVWYVDHRSLWFDLKILGLTVQKVLKREDIGPPGCLEASVVQIAAIKQAKQLSSVDS